MIDMWMIHCMFGVS